jgi:uncharacterized SAM-binding protein YcdF (DUF218 family)
VASRDVCPAVSLLSLYKSKSLTGTAAKKNNDFYFCIFAVLMINNTTLDLAKKLWDYHHMHHTLEKADCILVLGSHDLRVAEHAAQLYLDGWAPLIIFSGGLGNFTREMWKETEADQFAAMAKKMGVPEDAILIENKSTNTGENILFTQQLLALKGLDPQSFIVVQKTIHGKKKLRNVQGNTGLIKN